MDTFEALSDKKASDSRYITDCGQFNILIFHLLLVNGNCFIPNTQKTFSNIGVKENRITSTLTVLWNNDIPGFFILNGSSGVKCCA